MSVHFRGPMKLKADEDILLGLLPFYHIYGLVIVQFGSISQGTKLVTLPKFDPLIFLDSIQKHKVPAGKYCYLSKKLS